MNLIILPKSEELLDIAFRRARKEAAMLKSERVRIKDAKGKNIRRIESSSNYITKTIQKVQEGFPDMTKVNPFYKELISSTIDLEEALKALGQMAAGKKIIWSLRKQHIGRIKELEKEEAGKATGIVKEFYGRFSSVVKKLDKSIEKYNKAAKKMKELPSVKTDLPTAIIAGYPNTGKSTILGRLTESQPKVASYPFTTQKLEIGYLIHNYQKLQLIDTPGLLDRPLEERNRIEKKGIAAFRHLANLIVFVVDPTMECGFPLDKQGSLLEEIKKEMFDIPVVIVLNKADTASKEEIDKAKKLFEKALVEGNGIESGLKEEIIKLLEKKQ